MGSFNTTCGVTNAPIRDGDKVKLFFLTAELDSSNSASYITSTYTPIAAPISATYADYNEYTFDEDCPISKYILGFIKDHYSMNKIEEGKTIEDYNEYHDFMEVPVEELTWSKIFDMLHDTRLFLKQHVFFPEHRSAVYVMAIHETVYQIMLQSVPQFAVSFQEKLTHEDCVVQIKEIASNYEKANEEAQIQILFEALRENEKNNTKSDEELQILATKWTRLGTREKYFKYIRENSCHRNFRKNLRELLQTEGFAEQLVDFMFFHEAMCAMRKEYRPVMLGGQFTYYKWHADMLRKLADAVEALESPDTEAEERDFTPFSW